MAEPVVQPAGLLLIHGDEQHLVSTSCLAWLRAARERLGVEVEVFDAPALDLIRRSLTEVAMFQPERAVLVRNPPQLSDRARKGTEGAEALALLLDERTDDTALCLVVSSTVTAGNPVLAAVRRLGGTVEHHAALRPREARDWLDRELRQRRLRLGREGADHLLRVCGPDLGRLDQEMDKLLAFGGGAPVADHDVEVLVAGNEQVAVWAVLERILDGRGGRGVLAVDAMLGAGGSAQYLIATLFGQLRELLVAADLVADGQRASDIARTLHLPDWRAERLVRQAGVVRAAIVEEWLVELQRIDAATKAGEVNDVEALRRFALVAARDVLAARNRPPARR